MRRPSPKYVHLQDTNATLRAQIAMLETGNIAAVNEINSSRGRVLATEVERDNVRNMLNSANSEREYFKRRAEELTGRLARMERLIDGLHLVAETRGEHSFVHGAVCRTQPYTRVDLDQAKAHFAGRNTELAHTAEIARGVK